MTKEDQMKKLHWAFSQIEYFREKAQIGNDMELYKKLDWLCLGADSHDSREHNQKIYSFFEDLLKNDEVKFKNEDLEVFKEIAWTYRLLNNSWSDLPEFYAEFFNRFKKLSKYNSFEELPDSVRKYLNAISAKHNLPLTLFLGRSSVFNGLTLVEAINSAGFVPVRKILLSWGDARIIGTYPLPDEI